MTRKDCRDCPDRTMNCHSTCKTYLKLVERLDKIKAEREKDKAYDGYISDLTRKGRI